MEPGDGSADWSDDIDRAKLTRIQGLRAERQRWFCRRVGELRSKVEVTPRFGELMPS